MNEMAAFLLRALEENWIHARQSEDKRSMIAHAVILVTGFIQVSCAFLGFNSHTLFLTLFQTSLGIYALLATMKLYERSQFHTLRARKLRARLDELYPTAQVEQMQSLAEIEHRTHSPFWMNIRLNNIWLGLHILIIVLGVMEIFLCARF